MHKCYDLSINSCGFNCEKKSKFVSFYILHALSKLLIRPYVVKPVAVLYDNFGRSPEEKTYKPNHLT